MFHIIRGTPSTQSINIDLTSQKGFIIIRGMISQAKSRTSLGDVFEVAVALAIVGWIRRTRGACSCYVEGMLGSEATKSGYFESESKLLLHRFIKDMPW